ncbi:MAG: autotransporter-associated beta strand repeat-containing protein [Pirellulales bacterium]
MGKFLRLACPGLPRKRTVLACGIAAALGLVAAPTRAANFSWRSSGTDWNTAANWTASPAGFPNTGADIAILRNGFPNAQTQPNLSATVTLGTLNFAKEGYLTGFTVGASPGAALRLTSTGVSNNINTGPAAIVGLTGTDVVPHTITAPIVLAAAAGSNQYFSQDFGTTMVLAGPISSENNVTLNLIGAGTFELSGANSYSGNTSIGIPTNVKITNGDALGTASSTVTLRSFGGTSGKLSLAGNIAVNNKTLVIESTLSTVLTSAGNNTWNGNVSNPSSGWIESTSGTLTITGNVNNTSAGSNGLALQGNGAITITGVISGAGRLQRWNVGNGVLTLTGNNTYTSETNIYNGTISAASLNSVASPAAGSNLGRPTTVAAGTISLGSTTSGSVATLQYTGTGETTDRVVNLSSSTRTAQLDQSGTGLLKFTSDLTASVLGNKSLTLTGSTTGTGELAGAIPNHTSTTTGIIKSGTGTWTLSGNNPYSGNTAVNAGTLIARNTNALGHGGFAFLGVTPGTTTVAAGATLDIAGQSDVLEVLTLNGAGVGGNGALINSSATPMSLGSGLASLNLATGGGGYSAVPTVTVDAGTATAVATLGLTAASFTIENGGTGYTFGPTLTISGGGGSGATATATVSGGAITAITITNPGTGYTTTPTVTFSGGGGDAVITGNATNFQVSGLRLTSDGTGYATTPNLTIAGGTTAATATAIRSAITLAGDASIGGTGDITIQSVISGNFSLTKVGGNTLTLNAANTYTGTTTVTAGRLQGGGSIAGSLVNSGTVAPGNSIGTLTAAGDATFDAGGVFEAELGAGNGSDLLNLTSPGSNLSLATATDTLNLLSTLDPGTFTIIEFNGTRTGIFDLVNYNGVGQTLVSSELGVTNPTGFSGLGDLYTYGGVSVFYNDGGSAVQIAIAAIPEPSAFGLGGLALLGMCGVGLRLRRGGDKTTSKGEGCAGTERRVNHHRIH